MIKSKIKNYFLGGLIFLLSSCSFLSPVKLEQVNTYLINTVPHVQPKTTRGITLLVQQPDTRPVYNTKQIAYSLKPHQIAYYAQNQWAETPAQMLQPLLVQTLENTRHFRTIITPPYIGRYNYSLNTQIIEIQQDYTTTVPVMRLVVNVQIIRATTSQVVASKQFAIHIPIQQRSPYAGVMAANRATAILLNRIAEFCVEKI